eukprot:scaffold2420_cov124-Isochrysis_galbana.AAC.2
MGGGAKNKTAPQAAKGRRSAHTLWYDNKFRAPVCLGPPILPSVVCPAKGERLSDCSCPRAIASRL